MMMMMMMMMITRSTELSELAQKLRRDPEAAARCCPRGGICN